jgi:hypothetical protein
MRHRHLRSLSPTQAGLTGVTQRQVVCRDTFQLIGGALTFVPCLRRPSQQTMGMDRFGIQIRDGPPSLTCVDGRALASRGVPAQDRPLAVTQEQNLPGSCHAGAEEVLPGRMSV